MAAKLLESETIYSSKFTTLKKDKIQLEDGTVTYREIVVRPNAVVIVPVSNLDEYYFVRQERWASGGNLLELPAGKIEDNQTPLECAHKELQEEIKMDGYITHLAEFYASPGYSTELLWAFVAHGLHPSALVGDDDERIEIEVLRRVEVINALKSGTIRDAKSIAALSLYFLHPDNTFRGR